MKQTNELTNLPNIGKVVAEQLIDVGVETEEQLKNLGAKEAWQRILAMDPSACYNRLCGLQGAIEGIRWHDLEQETKEDLKAFYNAQKGKA